MIHINIKITYISDSEREIFFLFRVSLVYVLLNETQRGDFSATRLLF